MLKYFDDAAHEWRAEPGSFTLYIGGASDNTPAKARFTLAK